VRASWEGTSARAFYRLWPRAPVIMALFVAPPVPAQRLDGKSLAARIEADLTTEVAELQGKFGKAPCLAVVLVGDDSASKVYVGGKQRACKRVGIESKEFILPASASEDELVGLVEKLNRDSDINGILVQLPLPKHIHPGRILRSIAPYKDVDAFHPENVGHALIGDERLAPCTPQGILQLLDETGTTLQGAEVVIVNHSNIVGKPLAAMLMNRDATVTVCHKHTRDLAAHTRRADILVTGTGRVGIITGKMVKAGAVVVDVSMNRDADGKLCGDCTQDVWDVASWVTPVPGGVGPMTISVLLQNTVRSFKRKMGVIAGRYE
jgi:methylenetetrahydrofolate dehydrogenase (NADP+)/methenyltetrahydrofolate cyclohydrolase